MVSSTTVKYHGGEPTMPIHSDILSRVSRGAREVLDLIIAAHERGDTALVPDLRERLDRTESSLTHQLGILERENLVAVSRGGAGRGRVVELTEAGRRLSGLGIPELGMAPGGDLIYETALEGPDGAPRWIERLQDVIPYRPGDYCLRVTGDSMSGHGIMDGSRVYFHQVEWGQGVMEGTIVHVEVNHGEGCHQVTLKQWFADLEEGVAILKPSGLGFSDIVVPLDRVTVKGWAYHVERPLPGGICNSLLHYQNSAYERVAA